MRWTIVCLVALIPALGRGDASVRAKTAVRGRLCVQLHTARIERSAHGIEWAASVMPLGGEHREVRESTLRVRDAGGRVVFTDDRAFFAGERGPPWSLGLGMSTNGGPGLPELPAGGYTAVWSVDGFESAPARFTIGAAPPPLLALEWNACDCGARVVAHLYNPGPGDQNLLDALTGSILIVDGKRYARQGIMWDGNTTLRPGRSWSTGLSLDEYGVKISAGPHAIELEMGGHTARLDRVSADCAAN